MAFMSFPRKRESSTLKFFEKLDLSLFTLDSRLRGNDIMLFSYSYGQHLYL
ncbi:hypothetical protein RFEPED_0940 [Rickettsia felis str. Pedreira]|uniref:Uncharacterized protein n=1 Tax=Rickettsia felis str. Pedreira TaxID=1359196 RepID=A0A0F3MS17_RICFI|nr:hypothetical protein RFEPED_0940 [Rickettsia felis str. Pedreira]